VNRKDIQIRRLLWLYFFLVIFEGALRKWLLPGLAQPLLVARDPVCIIAILLGFHHLQKQPWVFGFVGVGALAIPLAIAFGHGNLPVAFFGARILLLHFPVLFLFGAVFDRADVWKFAKVTLLIAIPMTVLLAFQFYLPSTHIVNVGVGGEGTSIFSGAAGRHRASGTFSFTNGLTSFYALSGALFVGWLIAGPRPSPKWIWVSGASLIAALPLTISRTLAFYYAITGLFALISTGVSPKLLKRMIPAAIVLAIVVAGISQTSLFQNSLEAFSARWESATRIEGGDDGLIGVIENRVIDYGLLSAFQNFDEYPITGMGIGLGTNVGAKLMTGERTFLIAEGGWGAILGELGPFLGLFLLGYRIVFACALGIAGLQATRYGNALPLLLGSVAIQAMFMGNTSQPTDLGFLVLSCGLMLAAFNDSEDLENPETEALPSSKKIPPYA
tara:strand:- start:1685 stop:3016 length:1332 start_codon:yes stop_codon:yes gene_type:complete